MLIACPYCGPRDVSEYTYQGDANRPRPELSDGVEAWNDYVYGRVNTAGEHLEYWQHSGGCRSHLLVRRNTLTHAISSVETVRTAAAHAEPSSRRESGS